MINDPVDKLLYGARMKQAMTTQSPLPVRKKRRLTNLSRCLRAIALTKAALALSSVLIALCSFAGAFPLLAQKVDQRVKPLQSRPGPLPDLNSKREGVPALLDSADTIFRHLDQQKGLASPVISAFAEDGEGFLWIGTQSGVARWDGYRMRTYQMEVGVAETLPDNIVKTLFTDSQRRLWVGTNAGGLAGFDQKLSHFVSYPEDPRTGNHGRVAAIIGDGGQGLWIGTDLGLDHFDPVSRKFTHFHHPFKRFGVLPDGNRVTALIREPDGRLWVGTSGGLFLSDAKQENFAPVAIDTSRKSPVSVLSLLRDSTNVLWVGTLQGAFVLRNGDTMARPVHETGLTSPLEEQRVSSILWFDRPRPAWRRDAWHTRYRQPKKPQARTRPSARQYVGVFVLRPEPQSSDPKSKAKEQRRGSRGLARRKYCETAPMRPPEECEGYLPLVCLSGRIRITPRPK